MVLNHYFWTGIFRREFAPQLRAIVETLEKRVLPAFDNIDGEANAVAEETWDAFMSAPGTGVEDSATSPKPHKTRASPTTRCTTEFVRGWSIFSPQLCTMLLSSNS